jgi:hypothetical protein
MKNSTGTGTKNCRLFRKVSVADSDDFGLDPDPTFEKKNRIRLLKNADPDPALCKIVY